MVLYDSLKGDIEFLKRSNDIIKISGVMDSKFDDGLHERTQSLKRIEAALGIYEMGDEIKTKYKFTDAFMSVMQKQRWFSSTAVKNGYVTSKVVLGKDNITLTMPNGWFKIEFKEIRVGMSKDFIYEIEFVIDSVTLALGSDTKKYNYGPRVYFFTNSHLDMDNVGIMEELVQVASSVVLGFESNQEDFIPIRYRLDRMVAGVVNPLPSKVYTYEFYLSRGDR
ncbi:MAG: hypothetical protein ACRC7S_03730 [Cetobacterium sp.]